MSIEIQLAEHLSGRYRIGGEVGRGGMSSVYSAEDLRNERTVAIKVLRPDLSAAIGADRFLREIHILSSLQHPNILPLYDSGMAGDVLYYTMPLVEGETLGQCLKREVQLPVEDAVRIAREVGDALDYAHQHGIVHRDIKPENIFVTSGHAVVSDFGVARAITEAAGDEITRTGVTLGTPAYMSPEQASGDSALDGRCDIYALGCVLFEMLAGEPPFTGRTAQAVLARHMVEEPPSVEVLRQGIPPALATTVSKALAKSPVDRFETAHDLVVALRDSTAEHPAVPQRRRWWIPPVVLGFGALTAGLVWLVAQPGLPPTSPERIVVFPLAEHGLGEEENGAGGDAAFLINTALEHSEPLKWEDGWRWLASAERRDRSGVAPETARQISLARGAGYFIDGEIRAHGDSLTVALRLDDVRGDSTVGRESATGPAGVGAYATLTMDAMQRILPQLTDPGREIDLSAITDRDTRAIALYLQGERRYRMSQFEAAHELYDRAVEADSAFAFAAAKGAVAGRWLHEKDAIVERLLPMALAYDSLLPTRYSHFVQGLAAYQSGDAALAAESFGLALASDPEWAEAWMMLGETYYHLLPPVARPDSLVRHAFERAYALDHGFSPPLFHLTEIVLARGDLDRAWDTYRRYVEFGPPAELARQLELALRCAGAGPDRIDWQELIESDSVVVFQAAKQLSAALSHPQCAAAAFEALLGDPDRGGGEKWASLLGYQGLLAALGRDSLLRAVLDSAEAAGSYGPFYLYFIDEIAGSPVGDRAEANDAWVREEFGDRYEAFTGPMGLWHVGVWNAHRGRLPETRAIAGSLSDIADSTGRRDARLFAEALQGHLAAAEGDTTAAIELLGGLRCTHPPTDFAFALADPLAPERYLLSRLLLARGRYDEAIDVASVFDHPEPAIFLPFVPASLAVRYAATTALGHTERAAAYRERLRKLGRLDLIDGAPDSNPTRR